MSVHALKQGVEYCLDQTLLVATTGPSCQVIESVIASEDEILSRELHFHWAVGLDVAGIVKFVPYSRVDAFLDFVWTLALSYSLCISQVDPPQLLGGQCYVRNELAG